jgi:hypothetical protein
MYSIAALPAKVTRPRWFRVLAEAARHGSTSVASPMNIITFRLPSSSRARVELIATLLRPVYFAIVWAGRR